MSGFTARAVLVLLGVGTAFPLMALFNPDSLSSAYGVEDPDASVLALLQHRGILQAILGSGLVYAAFRPAARVPVALAAITTKGAGFALMFTHGETPNALTLVFDSIALVYLTALVIGTLGNAARARRPAARQMAASR
jgi:hypothetical protein